MSKNSKNTLTNTLKSSSSRLGLRALEPRILLDAAGFVTGADVAMEALDTQSVAEDMALLFENTAMEEEQREQLEHIDTLLLALSDAEESKDTATLPLHDGGKDYDIKSTTPVIMDDGGKDYGIKIVTPVTSSDRINATLTEATTPTGEAPSLDLDSVDTAPTPGTDGFSSFSFGNPTITNDGQTEANDGVGNGETALYENVGLFNGQDVDLRAVTVSVDGGDPDFNLTDFGDGNDDNANVTLASNSVTVVRWEVIDSDTGAPVAANFTLLITDLDQAGNQNNGFAGERISVSQDAIDGYVLNGVSDLTPTLVGDVLTFEPADDDPGTPGQDPTNGVQLVFSSTSNFEITYDRSGARNFTFDGNFTSIFTDAETTDTNADYGAVFTEGEAPQAIANDTIQIIDDGDIAGATITLTNPEADDRINVPVNLPTGITVQFSNDNQIILTGTATPDEYEQAILAITFENTSTDPNETTTRLIDITITDDGNNTSNLATAAMEVVAVAGSVVPPVNIVATNDTDMDGVSDENDIDDDNDGILDTAEGDGGTYTGQFDYEVDEFDTDGVVGFSSSVAELDGEEITTGQSSEHEHGDRSPLLSEGDVVTFSLNGGTLILAVTIDQLSADAEIGIKYQNEGGNPNFELRGVSDAEDLEERADLNLQFFDATDPAFAAANGFGDIAQIISSGGGDPVQVTSSIRISDIDLDGRLEGVSASLSSLASYTLEGDNGSFTPVIEDESVVFRGTVVNPTDNVQLNFLNVDAFDISLLNNQDSRAGFSFNFSQFGFNTAETTTTGLDSDGDGIDDHLDIDSDNDGITDNIEAQTTVGYIAPNADDAATLEINTGLNSAYVPTNGLIAVNTDGDDFADYIDTDSDDEGAGDTIEAGLTGTAVDLSDATTDADGDGLFDVFDTQNGTLADDGFDVNESNATGAAALLDSDGDASGGVPLVEDVDFRDATLPLDTDDDGVIDDIDIDDDNDGILDEDEGLEATSFNPDAMELTRSGTTTDISGIETNLALNDELRFTSAININGQDIDVILTVLEVTNFSSDGYFHTSTSVSSPSIVIRDDTENEPYVRYSIEFVESGTTTPVTLPGTTVLRISDIDSNVDLDESELVGISTGDADSVELGDNLISGGFVNGTIDPVGFDFFSLDPAGTGDAGDFVDEINENGNDENILFASFTDLAQTEFIIGVTGTSDRTRGHGFAIVGFSNTSGTDSDGDGVYDHLDIDSDNDGITDNIEAQTTAGYIAPNADDAATLTSNDGLNSAYVPTNGLTAVNTDGTDAADFLDTDSDNDSLSDTLESGLTGTAIGLSDATTDADGDGLFDVFDAQNGTLADDGFDVNESNATGAAALPDTDGDASGGVPLTEDVDFRDIFDTDGDGVADYIDVDDDNDGILDTSEQVEVAVQGQLQFNHNENGGEGTGPSFVEYGGSPSVADVIANGEDTIIGTGLTVLMTGPGTDNASSYEFDLEGADSATFQDAVDNHDYIEMSFTTADSDLNLSYLFHSFSAQDAGGSNRGDYRVTYLISDDGFATSDVLVDDFQFQSGTSGSFNGQFPSVESHGLDADTRYSVRVYVYDAQNTPVGQITFNDQTFEFTQIVETDTDNDGIIDSLDIDSDNDGITDNIEAQTTDGYIAPNADDAATLTSNDGLNSAYVPTNGLTAVNTDGTDAVDYLDTDSDNDGLSDNSENGLGQSDIANGTVSDATTDLDGDGLFDQYETAIDGDANDGFVVNEGVDDPLSATNGYLPDGGDAIAGAIVPLSADLDYRDAIEDAVAPVAQDDAFAINENPEDGTSEIGVITNGELLVDNENGVDNDANGDTLSITQINGVDITNGEQITLASGALLTIRTDGTFDYDPNGAFDYLDTDEIGTDTFTYTLSDGTVAPTDFASVTITVSGDNDIPTIDLNGALPGTNFDDVFIEDEPGQPLANLLSFDAVIQDDENNISVVNIIPSLPIQNDGTDEYLRIDSEGIELSIRLIDGEIVAGTPLVFGDTTFVVTSTSGVVSITNADGGTFDSDDLQGFLRLLAYENVNQDNSDGIRAFNFQVIDPAGVTVATSSITVARVNDAPVPTVSVIANGTVVEYGVDTPEAIAVVSPDSGITEITVAELLAQLDITDIEDSDFGIGIIGADETQGVWQYTRPDIEGHEWTDFQLGDDDNTDATPVPDGEALLMDPDAILRFVADPGFSSDAALVFRVWDQTVGTASNPPSTVTDDSGAVAPTNTSSLSTAAFAVSLAADTDGDGIINSDDVDDDNDGILDTEEGYAIDTSGVVTVEDADGDGYYDHLDIDSDDDGITDNIEAQTTAGYIAPTGTATGITDVNQDGLDDAYDSRNGSLTATSGAATAAESIISPPDTDGLGEADFLDPDSDDDGISDATENGLGVIYDATDTDGDGLADVYEAALDGNVNDGFVVNEGILPLDGTLPDTDGDASGVIVPGTADLDYRDIFDTDNDGVADNHDIDDDNDGILDTFEGLGGLPDGTTIEAVLGGTGLTTDGVLWNSVLDQLPSEQVTVEGFETFATGTDLNGTQFDGFTMSVTNSESASRNYSIANTIYGTSPLSGSNQAGIRIGGSTGSETTVEINFDEPVVGFGLNLGDLHDGVGQSQFIIEFDGVVVWDSNDLLGADMTGTVTNDITGETVDLGNQTFGFIGSYDLDNAVSQVTIRHIDGGGDNFTIDDISYITASVDSDGDGIANHLDIDSDNDGITDNVEAQTTADYIAPSGQGGIADFVDVDGDGLDDNYDADTAVATTTSTTSAGLTPVNTDAGATTPDDTSDYLDTDSDNDGLNDTLEAGLGTTAATGLSDASTDADGDGLFDVFEGTSITDGFDVNDENLDATGTNFTLSGVPALNADGSNAVPLVTDLDFRDVNDAPITTGTFATQSGVDSAEQTPFDASTIFTDPDGDTLAFTSPDLPSWMSINSATGIITGTPPADASQGGLAGEYVMTIVATDPDGESVSQTLSYNFINPAPVVDTAVANQTAVDGETISIPSGFVDPDGDVVAYTATGLPAGLSIDPLTGEITGTIDNSASQVGPNNDGVYTIAVTVNDSEGGVVTDMFALTVTNPAPEAVDDDLTASEDADLTGNVITGSDIDNDPDGDDLTVIEVGGVAANVGLPIAGSNGGLFTISPDGSYEFEANGEFEGLDVGESATTTITYMISDNEGGTDTATVTVTVEGQNDAPVLVDPNDPNATNPTIPEQVGVDSEALPELDLSDYFVDPDGEQTFFDLEDAPSWLTVNPFTGVITATAPPADASQNGPANDGIYPITVVASDPDGVETRVIVNYVISNPVPIAQDDAFLADENGPVITGNLISVDNGNGVDSDPDGDVLSVADVNGDPAGVGQPVEGSIGGEFTVNLDGSYSFDANGDFEYLAVGETATTTLTYLLTDADGATDLATVSVTVAGSNDSPIPVDPTQSVGPVDTSDPFDPQDPRDPPVDPQDYIPAQIGVDGTVFTSFDLSPYFGDPDGTDTTTVSIDPADLPDGLVFDGVTLSGTPTADASQGGVNGVYDIPVTATDPSGETFTTIVQVTITNPAPIAQNDVELTDEDTVLSDTVMTDNGNGIDSDFDGDVLSVTEVNGMPITSGTVITLPSGALLTMNDDGSYDYDPNGQFEGLAVGENGTDSFTYQISDGQGGFSDATVSLTVEGVNDAPIAVDPTQSVGPSDPSDPSDPQDPRDPPVDPLNYIPVQDAVDGSLITPIDLTPYFGDPDGADALTLSIDPTDLPDGLVFDGTMITGTPTADASQGGVDGVYTIAVTAMDPSGETFTTNLTYEVTNPAPDAVDDVFTTPEDTPLTVNIIDNSDVDPDGDVIVVDAVALPDGTVIPVGVATEIPQGTLTVLADGTVTLDPARDLSGPVIFGYTLSDGQGGTDVATVTIDVTPVNDAPIPVDPTQAIAEPNNPNFPTDPETPFTPPLDPTDYIPAQTADDSATITPLDLTPYFGDPDPMEPLVISLDPSDLPAGLVFDPATGIISGTPDLDASQGGDPLSPGTYVIPVTVTDPSGETFTTNVIYTVSNPAPTAVDDAFDVNEDTTIMGSVIAANDVDPDGDVLTVIEVDGDPLNVGQAIAGSNGGLFTIDETGALTFDTNGEYEALDVGETLTTSVTYEISDGEGGTDTAIATVTVLGTNDAPIMTGTLAPQNGPDSAEQLPLDTSTIFTDVDDEPLTFTSPNLPTWMTLDPDTGLLTGTPPADASQGGLNSDGVYVVTITATDPDGESVSSPVVYTFTNVAPDALDDDLASDEDTSLSGNVLTSNDVDPDGDLLTVSSVDGNSVNVGVPVIGSMGGEFTLNSDGSYTFDPAGDFNALAEGETATTTITYEISDGEGGTDIATVTVTVIGTNDAPIAVDPTQPVTPTGDPTVVVDPQDPRAAPFDPNDYIPAQIATDNAPATPLDLTPYFGDPDSPDEVVLSIDPADLPPGLTFDGTTISGTPNADASQFVNNGVFEIPVTATDPSGESFTTIVTYTVANTAPVAENDVFSTLEDTPISVNVISANDSDLDGDVLSIDAAALPNGELLPIGTPITLPEGLLTISEDGTVDFVPAPDFFGPLIFGYTLTDNEGGTDVATVTLNVTPVNDAPIAVDPTQPVAEPNNPDFSTDPETPMAPPADLENYIPLQTGIDNSPVTPLDLTQYFGDPDPMETLVISVDPNELPEGLVFDPVTGVISGTPSSDASQGGTDGVYVIPVTATDSNGESFTTNVTYIFTNLAPIVGTPVMPAIAPVVGEVISIDLGAVTQDPDNDSVLTYSSTNLPAGLSLDPVTGMITGAPLVPQADPYIISLSVSDGEGGVTEFSIALQVNEDGYVAQSNSVKPAGAEDLIDPYEFLEGQPIDLQLYFRERALEASDDSGRTFGDRDFRGGMVAMDVPGMRGDCSYMFVEAVAFDQNVTVSLGSTFPMSCDVNVRTWDVNMADGSPLPAWVDWSNGADFMDMTRPLGTDTVSLKVRALLDNGRTSSATVEINLSTGTVTQVGDAFAQGQTLQQQLALETLTMSEQVAEVDVAQDALLRALTG